MLGATAALLSAFSWAVAAVLFSRLGNEVSAAGLNLSKGLIALLCLSFALWPEGLSIVDSQSMIALALSGIVGIALGDTLYFLTLMKLGPRLTLLTGNLIPIVTGIFAVILFNEQVPAWGWLGILITLAGVGYVLWDKAPRAAIGIVEWRQGVVWALLFVFANALGILLTKVGVVQLSAYEASFIRQAWAIAAIVAWGLASGALLEWVKPLQNRRLWLPLFAAAIIGAFIGAWLSVAALKYTHAAVAATLNSTSPLFILPLAAIFLREKISVRAWLGAVVALSGIGIYFASVV